MDYVPKVIFAYMNELFILTDLKNAREFVVIPSTKTENPVSPTVDFMFVSFDLADLLAKIMNAVMKPGMK